MIAFRSAASASGRAAAVLATLLLAACGSAGRPAAGPASPATVPTASLATSLSSATGTWVTVPMGETNDPLNTYWELLYLGAGAANWIVRTPADVADNGGLVMGETNDGLDVAFRPSNQLRFTPLAVTTDGGATYAPGLVPVPLADVPDSLSVNAVGQASVLTNSGVLTSATGLSGWQPSLTLANLTDSPAGRTCRPQQLTAVAETGLARYVAASCASPGVVGILSVSGSGAELAGPLLSGADAAAHVSVLRLVAYKQGLAALLALTDHALTSYLALWNPTIGNPGRGASSGWMISPALSLPGTLKSAAVTSQTGFALLSADTHGARNAALIAPGDIHWTALPQPPADATTLAVSDARTDAIAAGTTDFTAYTLAEGQWRRTQTTHVDIPFGSSN